MNEKLVWAWIDNDKPGYFLFSSAEECLRAAWANSGLDMSCVDFTDILHRLGLRPAPAPATGDPSGPSSQFILRFPSLRIVGGRDHDRELQ